jgi:hypothetical protein
MSSHSAGGLTAGAGSTTLPLISVYAQAALTGVLREVGFFNTTAVAVALKLVRLTSAATQGSGLVEAVHDPDGPASGLLAFQTHSSTGPTLGDDLGYRCTLAGTIGAGIIWTFEPGIRIPIGTANGVGLIVENGTGQVLQAYFKWDS